MDMQRTNPKYRLSQTHGKALVVQMDKEDWQKFMPISDYMKMAPSKLGHLLLIQVLLQYQQKERLKNDFIKFVSPKSVIKSLTTREIEIIKLAAQGTSNRGIAVILGISEQTTKNHISSILHKLNAENRTHAVVLALEHNLVESQMNNNNNNDNNFHLVPSVK